ncbi:hypothetical protein Y032_1158g3712 [Ancylostoma ceylanicum]|uniref:Uncharacterized protein n=1 Tax=Ancylostoma ceylanicum TaxID=53326 RepID=A0A016W7X0_9BILA|nr:hypothetical protein Y032_1158g3712 [Ancylostoma ceylanicum]
MADTGSTGSVGELMWYPSCHHSSLPECVVAVDDDRVMAHEHLRKFADRCRWSLFKRFSQVIVGRPVVEPLKRCVARSKSLQQAAYRRMARNRRTECSVDVICCPLCSGNSSVLVQHNCLE